jgi:hypothetical protein
MGGSKVNADITAMAEELGCLIAQRGWVLLNGGRNQGVMAASARGAKQAGGTVIGILPGKTKSDASPDLDVAIVTGMGDARNVINILSSDVIIACPGALGTLSEIVLGLKAKRRIVMLGHDEMPELKKFHRKGQLKYALRPEEAVRIVEEWLGG